MAVLPAPAVLADRAAEPKATFRYPEVLDSSAALPNAALPAPVVFEYREL